MSDNSETVSFSPRWRLQLSCSVLIDQFLWGQILFRFLSANHAGVSQQTAVQKYQRYVWGDFINSVTITPSVQSSHCDMSRSVHQVISFINICVTKPGKKNQKGLSSYCKWTPGAFIVKKEYQTKALSRTKQLRTIKSNCCFAFRTETKATKLKQKQMVWEKTNRKQQKVHLQLFGSSF